jgi:hypothetical protein
MEHRTATTLLQRTRFSDTIFSSAHDIQAALASASILFRQVCFRRPTLRFPWGFHSRDCLVMFSVGFHSVWPLHPHFLFFLGDAYSSQLGIWSHLWYIRGAVLAYLFLWLVIPADVSRLITLLYLSHFFSWSLAQWGLAQFSPRGFVWKSL